jgi:two-component system KDP operon response regulator KdpE
VSLAALGLEVEEAETAEKAWALLRANHYDLALLNIDTPGMGGIESCREIRRLSPPSAVLMFTLRDCEEDQAKIFQIDADDCVPKAFAFRDFVAHIRAVLDSPPSEAHPRNWLAGS